MQTMRELMRLVGGMKVDERADPQSAEFKAWFRDSKVVDDQGNPLLCYHGTNAKGFETFRPLTHFGSLRAANYVSTAYGGGTPRVHAVYLRIVSPCVVRDSDATAEEQLEEWAGEMFSSEKYSAVIRAAIDAPKKDWTPHPKGGLIPPREPQAKLFVQLAKRHGYDGLRYVNKREDRGHVSWVIFDPDQVWPVTLDRPDTVGVTD